jgi:hypothetical protein
MENVGKQRKIKKKSSLRSCEKNEKRHKNISQVEIGNKNEEMLCWS